MNTLNQLAKSVLWGICALISALLIVGGGYGAFLHSLSLRDVSETTAKAREVSAEVAVLDERIRDAFNKSELIEGFPDPDLSTLGDMQELRGSLVNDEMRLFQVLNSEFCGDGWRFGCVFSRFDSRYEKMMTSYREGRKDPVSLTSEAHLATYWWASDVKLYIDRQQDSEQVTYENSVRRESLLGALGAFLIGAYLLVALLRFKVLAPSEYAALGVLGLVPLLWAFLFATNYLDPAIGTVRNIVPIKNFSEIVFFGSFIYPFLVAPPLYVFVKKRGTSFLHLLLLRGKKESSG
jgi:hypothetical protein